MARVLIGTSGWHYDSWRGPFFPNGLPLKAQLQFYASQSPSAELNGVFYRTPTREAVESWRAQTGKDFVFAWKASKFITHWKRLSESSANSLELLEDRLSLLGSKVGPVLFQLPPNFRMNEERLGGFLKMLSSKRRYSFEFRDPSWYARAFSGCCLHIIFHFACRTITMRPRLGSEQQTSFTSEATAQAAATKATTASALCSIGPRASALGRSRARMSTYTSTTIRRARRQPMH
jgi:uncharacterized protein YecE (DUF72 family)